MTDNHIYDYDFFVIGAGSGGVRAARIAAGHGAKVGIAEGRFLGGTCVNVGCVPKKLMAYAADYAAHFADAKGFGWSLPGAAANATPSFSWEIFRRAKDSEIARLNGIYRKLIENAGVTLHEGYARFVDPHKIRIADKTVTAAKILIATGGRPRPLNIPGGEHARTSDDMFYLDTLPKRAVILGGGYIAVEFAHILHGLGVEIDLLYRGSLFLRHFDDDIRLFLAEEMKKQGINVYFHENPAKIEKDTQGYTVHTDAEHTYACDFILSAIGRDPATEGLGLQDAGCLTAGSGRIERDPQTYQTNIPHIYAIGDVTNADNLTPVAIAEGHALADHLFGGQDMRSVDTSIIPTAVFSDPAIGTCGLTEEQARANGYGIEIYRSTFRPMVHTLSGRDEKTLMKLVVDKKSRKVLGIHMAGRDAPEIMQGFGVALQCGAKKEDFDHTIPIHPTSAEEFVTMRTPCET